MDFYEWLIGQLGGLNKKKYYSFKSGNLEDKYKETGGSWRLLHSTIKSCFRYLDSYLKMLRIKKKKEIL